MPPKQASSIKPRPSYIQTSVSSYGREFLIKINELSENPQRPIAHTISENFGATLIKHQRYGIKYPT